MQGAWCHLLLYKADSPSNLSFWFPPLPRDYFWHLLSSIFSVKEHLLTLLPNSSSIRTQSHLRLICRWPLVFLGKPRFPRLCSGIASQFGIICAKNMTAVLAVPNAHSSIWFCAHASPRSCNASEIINLWTFWHYSQQKRVLDVHIGSVSITGERWPILVAEGHVKITFHNFPWLLPHNSPFHSQWRAEAPTTVLRSFLVSDPIWKRVSKTHCYWIKEHSIAPEHSGLLLWISENRGSWVPRIWMKYGCLFLGG